jgi:UDP-glucose:(heptosyl)LPS alpha-1,3-glucosyltransferase
LKIYLFTKYLANYGGAERIAFRFAQYLSEKGIGVKVFCGKNKLNAPVNFEVQEIGLGKSRYGKAKVFYDRASEIAEQLDGVVFSFERMQNADIYRPGGGVHKIFMQNSLRGLNGYQKLRKKIKRAIDPVNRLNPLIEAKTFASNRLKYVIANSYKLKKELESEYPDTSGEIVVIHNGVKKEIFNFERRTLLSEKNRNEVKIGFAASNFQLKGLAYLIEALALLPENFTLQVAGGRNPDQYIKLAKSISVEKRVTFLGKVSEMDKFYANIDVFCLPTFFDNFANVISEAVAMGTPSCTSEFAGSNEIIKKGINGDVFTEITPEKIAESINVCAKIKPDDFSKYIQSDTEVFDRYLEMCVKAFK